MADIDFGLLYQFVDPADGVPRQLRFRLAGSDPQISGHTGQLVAVVADGTRSDRGHTLTLSRAGVDFAAVETALTDWQTWAMIGDSAVNLAEIRRRIHRAALD